jgi:hypothetical protein
MGLKDFFAKLFGGQEEVAEENLTSSSNEVAGDKDVDQTASSSEEEETKTVREEQEEISSESQGSAEEISASNEGELKIEPVDGPENIESAEEISGIDKLNPEASEEEINKKTEFTGVAPGETNTESK